MLECSQQIHLDNQWLPQVPSQMSNEALELGRVAHELELSANHQQQAVPLFYMSNILE